MNKLELLMYESYSSGLDIVGIDFSSPRIKGLYCDGTIALSNGLENTREKTSVLAEELGHYHTSVGNIILQSCAKNRKQEQLARLWAYNHLVGLYGIVNCYKSGCQSLHDMAEHLDVSEYFLNKALERYRQKYGRYTTFDNYVIYFEPNLRVVEII